ncbi:MAG TPA: hypothetical protein VOA64_11985 [Candidatus Dormibacteraeota bacterium]|nr:hypothetical protein [Candidatus Dormibacteraeota bacterium]
MADEFDLDDLRCRLDLTGSHFPVGGEGEASHPGLVFAAAILCKSGVAEVYALDHY